MSQGNTPKSLVPGAILADLQSREFYGSLEFVFQGGRIVLMRKTETLKAPLQDQRNNRGGNEQPGRT
jgi:hypothetical protein